MDVRLDGRNVLVTGASRGIGKAIALAMGKAGARVACHGFSNPDSAAAVAASAGNGSAPFLADLATTDGPASLFDEVLKAFGHLDVLVNNAAVALEMPPDMADDAWLAAWDKTMTVNVRAAEMLSRKAALHFSGCQGGRMIHIASRAAHRGDTPEYVTYAASKGALVAMSKSYARGFGKQGVCSFVIAPGFVRTDMAADFIERYGEAYVANDIALSRLTEPEDLGPVAVLLASGLADHATGATIDVNAGSYVR